MDPRRVAAAVLVVATIWLLLTRRKVDTYAVDWSLIEAPYKLEPDPYLLERF